MVGPQTERRLGDRNPLQRLGREGLKNFTEIVDICVLLWGASETS
jgi:hypothetical protein